MAKTKDNLNQELVTKKEALRAIRFGAAGSKSTNVKSIKTLRREIAQIMTKINHHDDN